jgi:hypothetical protein
VMPGAATVPEADFICPVIAASPFLGKEPVTSEAKSVKLALTCEEEMVAPALNELDTVIVPLPFLGIARTPIPLRGKSRYSFRDGKEEKADVCLRLVGQHAPTLQQPALSSISSLRRTRYSSLRTLGHIRKRCGAGEHPNLFGEAVYDELI